MDLMHLKATLTLDKSDYEKGIKKVSKGVEEAKEQTNGFSKSSKEMKIIATNAWIQIAKDVARAVKGIAGAIKGLIDFADNYSDLSAKYDISTQSLQEFEYIASQTGATLYGVLSTMTMMYNRAKDNNDVFDKLGVSVTDVNGNMKSMDTLFWEVKNALDNVTNSGDKSALMLEIFGRNAMQIGEFLRKDTTELEAMALRANELGIVLSDKAVESASMFNDKLAELQQMGKSAFADFLFGDDVDGKKIEQWLDAVIKIIDKLLPKLLPLIERIGVLISRTMLNLLPSMINALIDFVIDYIVYTLTSWEYQKKMYLAAFKIIGGIFKGVFQGIINGFSHLIGGGDVFESSAPSIDTGLSERVSSIVSTTNSSAVTDNSTYDVDININGGNYSQEEAKELADMVIKEIATQKQAKGR